MKAPALPPKEPFPAGTHMAVCYSVVDFGIQDTEWQGQKKQTHQIRLQWEVPILRIKYEKDGKELEGPKVIGKTYTFSMGDKCHLNHHLTAWGYTNLKSLEMETVIGQSCLLNVAHTVPKEQGDPVYSYITTVMQLTQGTTPLTPENPTCFYSIQQHGKNFPVGVYPWMQEAIEKSAEFVGMANAAKAGLGSAPVDDEQPPVGEDVTNYGEEGYTPPADDPIPF